MQISLQTLSFPTSPTLPVAIQPATPRWARTRRMNVTKSHFETYVRRICALFEFRYAHMPSARSPSSPNEEKAAPRLLGNRKEI